MLEAIRHGLDHIMSENHHAMILGQDVGHSGGVFRATEGLQKRYGDQRVIDMPISESLIAGMALGMSYQGLLPVVEFQFMGFVYAALEQLISHISRMHQRTLGDRHTPLIIRMPFGAGVKAPEHHSESTEALLGHIPHLKLVIPCSPSLAYTHLIAASRAKEPTIILEHKALYHRSSEDLYYQQDMIDKAIIKRQGRQATIICWGQCVPLALEHAANSAYDLTVIDVNVISPIDWKTLSQAVNQTGRCIIIQEAAKSVSIGSDIAAYIAHECLTQLLAPIELVAGLDTIVPCPQFERLYLPNHQRLEQAIDRTMLCR